MCHNRYDINVYVFNFPCTFSLCLTSIPKCRPLFHCLPYFHHLESLCFFHLRPSFHHLESLWYFHHYLPLHYQAHSLRLYIIYTLFLPPPLFHHGPHFYRRHFLATPPFSIVVPPSFDPLLTVSPPSNPFPLFIVVPHFTSIPFSIVVPWKVYHFITTTPINFCSFIIVFSNWTNVWQVCITIYPDVCLWFFHLTKYKQVNNFFIRYPKEKKYAYITTNYTYIHTYIYCFISSNGSTDRIELRSIV